ncbi:MAG TPA: hypothetical protein DCE44_06575 [Verrucomicrobiales bacterium]|nr:hypothetical protein [Verrucomicrobiales bacterium]
MAGPLLRINELQSSNGETLRDENADAPDWFELTNVGDAPANLDGWGVSDDPDRPFRWRFQGGSLAPGEFLVVFASGKDRQPVPTDARAPESVGGLVLWLRADTVNPDDPGQVRAVGAARLVQRWNDSINQVGPARQPSATSQPEWRNAVVNGLPALHFDGADDGLRVIRPAGTNSFTLMAVARPVMAQENDPESIGGVGGISGQRWLFGAEHGGDRNGGAGVSLGVNGASVYEHGSSYMPALAVAPTDIGVDFTVVTVVYDLKRPRLYLAGALAREGMASPRDYVTAPLEIGSGAYGAFGGDIAEILMFDRALSDAERRGVEAGLGVKYALPLGQWRHTNFQLSSTGEVLLLTRPDGSLADAVTFGPVPRDVSFGRTTNDQSAWRFFAEPTPGRANTTPGSAEFLEPPAFSHAGGFYMNEFLLELSTSSTAAEIVYTLDGSEPNESSTRYSGPIRVRSRAGTPNTIANIPTTPGGAIPAGEVFKGWSVRARTIKSGALASSVVTRSFFVAPAGRARYSVPVVALTTARDNFFGAERGIYVPGNQGNYNQRGAEWERPVFVEIFETNNATLISQPAGVKIHGNTSQNFPVKGLDLDATAFEGRRPFQARLFPDRPWDVYEHVLLRPTGHDQMYAFQRDELMQSLVEPFGVETQAARLVVVFINGEYWGLHYLKNKEDAEFVARAANVPESELDYLEGYAAPRAGDLVRWNEMMGFLQSHDLSVATNYAWMTNALEPLNYALYKVAESFTYRWDIGNHRLWRPRTPDGRFRWLQFDNDVGWGGFWADQPAWDVDMLEHQLQGTGGLHGHSNADTTRLFGGLMENREFRRLFLNVYSDLLNSAYLPAHSIALIDGYSATLAPEMSEHIRRWRSPGSLAEWRTHVEYLREFARKRPAAVRRQLQSRFPILGLSSLSLAVSDPAGGILQTTLLGITNSPDQRWIGTYFRNNPLTLTAQPNPGWRFAGWREIPTGGLSTLTLAMTGDVELTAEFAELPVAIETIRQLPSGNVIIAGRSAPRILALLERSIDLDEWLPERTLEPDDQGRWEIEVPAPSSSVSWWRLRRQPANSEMLLR